MWLGDNLKPFTTYEYIDNRNDLNRILVYCYPRKFAGMNVKMPNDHYIGESHFKVKNLTASYTKKCFIRLRQINKKYNQKMGVSERLSSREDLSTFTATPTDEPPHTL